MKEWELCKCFRAFNTVYGKLSPRKLSPVRLPLYPNPNLNRKPNAGEFVEWGGAVFWGQFYGHNLNSTFQTKINVTSSVG